MKPVKIILSCLLMIAIVQNCNSEETEDERFTNWTLQVLNRRNEKYLAWAFDLIYSVVNIELSYVKFKTLIYRRDFRLVFVLFHGNQVTVTG